MAKASDDEVLSWLTDHEWNLLLEGKDAAVKVSLMRFRGMTEAEVNNIIRIAKKRMGL